MIVRIIEPWAGGTPGGSGAPTLNVDDARETVGRHGIRSIPAIGFFRDGDPVGGVGSGLENDED